MASRGELPSSQRGATEQMADAKEFAASPSADVRPKGCKPCIRCQEPCTPCRDCQAPCTKCTCNVG